ncbi:discoidin domain-containing protein [Bacilliculturomica massiliensis]|uniref:discoidin domain-containing protein n=1 Tax=Bacilliculturomica massiliensis TaxID=1917867 RepID=UPI00102F31E7|nr:discoidin domain-containing protein [Bacilliculturomica massiliensis]
MPDKTTNYGLTKPYGNEFYDIGIFNGNSDLVDAALKEQADALSEKADDDFTHIPYAVCETAVTEAIKEVTISGYNPEKHPIIAVMFRDGINYTEGSALKLAVNGGTARAIYSSFAANMSAGNKGMSLMSGATLLLSTVSDTATWRVVGMPGRATTTLHGITTLANVPGNEFSTSLSATTPNYVKALALCSYESGRTYAANALVTQDGSIYKSLQDNNIGHAVTEPEWWEQYGGTVTPEPDPEQVINYTMLYDQGDECAAVTGGWESANSGSGAAFDRTITNSSNCLKIMAAGSQGVGIGLRTSNLIDLTNFNKFFVCADGERIKYSTYIGYITTATNTVLSGTNGWESGSTRGSSIEFSDTDTASLYGTITELDVSQIANGYLGGFIFAPRSGTYIMRAASILKSDDPARLISTAGITTPYTTPDAFAADASNRSAILSNPKAVKIMTLTCTGDLMYAILNNADWITAIKANDEAYRIIMSNPHWSKFAGIIPAAKDLLGYTMLYDQGDECEAVTGGWNGIYKEPGNYTTSQLTLGQSDMFGAVPSGALTWKYRACTNSIDLSEHEKILCCFSFSSTVKENGNSMSFRIAKDTTWPSDAVQALALNSDQTVVNKGYVAKIFDVPTVRRIGYIIIDLIGTGATAVAASGSYKLLCALRSDPWQTWATKGGLTASYATLDALLSDSSAMAILMSNRDAISYMISCTGTLMAAICNSETAMSALVNSPVAYDAAFTNSHWRKFMLMCPVSLAAMDSVAKTVPLMTSNTTPEGVASASNVVNASYDAYKAFDRIRNNAGWVTASGYNTNQWIEYEFSQNVSVYRVEIMPRTTYAEQNIKNFKIQHYCSGVWIDALSAVLLNNSTLQNFTINSNAKSARWRVYCLDNYGNAQLSIDEIQFYGKEVI